MSSILFDEQSETAAPPKVLNRRVVAWSVGGLLIAIVIGAGRMAPDAGADGQAGSRRVRHPNGIGDGGGRERGAFHRQHHRHHRRALRHAHRR